MRRQLAARSIPRLVIAPVALVLLFGCDRAPDETRAVEPDKAQSVKPVETSSVDGRASENTDESAEPAIMPPAGEYVLEIEEGKISLRANRSSRMAILDELAWQTGFEIEYNLDGDATVSIERRMAGMAELLAVLLEELDYTAEYGARANDQGFRLVRLSLGPANRQYENVGEGLSAEPPPELAGVFPQAEAEIYLGAEPDEADLATRLQYGTIEDQIAALEELDLDPAGLNAAYQVYTQTTSAEVRIAVLELIEAEDSYLARSMIVLSLQSFDPAEAMYALEIVDAQDDYSLAGQVRALASHHDAGVRELAAEVLESITANFAEADESGAAPLNYGAQIPLETSRDIDADR